MARPMIFTVSATWDADASAWSGYCDEIPAAADAPTLDELLEKVSLMALDLAQDNYPKVDPEAIFIQVVALREAVRLRPEWRRSSIGLCAICLRSPAAS